MRKTYYLLSWRTEKEQNGLIFWITYRQRVNYKIKVGPSTTVGFDCNRQHCVYMFSTFTRVLIVRPIDVVCRTTFGSNFFIYVHGYVYDIIIFFFFLINYYRVFKFIFLRFHITYILSPKPCHLRKFAFPSCDCKIIYYKIPLAACIHINEFSNNSCYRRAMFMID